MSEYTEGLGRGMSVDDLRQAFVEALELPAGTEVEALEIGKDPHWDSVGIWRSSESSRVASGSCSRRMTSSV